jgi:hypothetical protein
MKKIPALLILITLFFLSGEAARPQDVPPPQDRPGASRYVMGDEEALLMPVNVLGYVNKPGQYMVPAETDLVSLVAFAGGFKDGAKTSKVQLVRGFTNTTNGRLTKGANGQANITKVDVKKFFETGDRDMIPRMLPDDTVIVPGSGAVGVKNALDFVAKFVVLAQIYFYLSVADR